MEDLQGIPVRLLRDIEGFGRKHAIIRVKRGRMRNEWHHKGAAEYMTRERFQQMGLTKAAIGVRDRSFGKIDPNAPPKAKGEWWKRAQREKQEFWGSQRGEKRDARDDDDRQGPEFQIQNPMQPAEPLTLSPAEAHRLLSEILPKQLTFERRVISTAAPVFPEPEPVLPRSPSLGAQSYTSTQRDAEAEKARKLAEEAERIRKETELSVGPPIFGSVSVADIHTHVREWLEQNAKGNIIVLEPEHIKILGVAEGEIRIKNLGRFEVEIAIKQGETPVKRFIHVVAEEHV